MRTTYLFTGMVLTLFLLFVTCQSETGDRAEPSQEEMIARGEYLVTAMGCDDCHTPKKMGEMGPEPDLDRRLMGHPADLAIPEFDEAWVAPGQWILTNNDLTAWVGPWGISYTANLTSDESGIGSWTEEHFMRAIKEGLYKGLKGNRSLLPPMPWQQIRNLNDDDLRAIFAFLKSTNPHRNVVPQPTIFAPPSQ